MTGDQHAAGAARSAAGVSRPAGIDAAKADPGVGELYARAQAARRQARDLDARFRAAQQATRETLQLIHAAQDRAERVRELWLAAVPGRLRYSPYARLQARLASMPVIEQAKGILMAQCGWTEEEAFDALRRASQRENIKLRDVAARVVANTARSAAAQRPAGPSPVVTPAPKEAATSR